jgi:hypothetical protein
VVSFHRHRTRNKGFTFEADELNEAQKIRLQQKRSYEMEQGLVPTGEELLLLEDGDEDDNMMLPATATTTSAAAAAVSTINTNNNLANITSSCSNSGGGVIDAEAAKAKAQLIAQQLIAARITTTSTTSSTFSGVPHSQQPEYVHDELDINDYPAQARKRVLSRVATEQLMERIDGLSVIITRGMYIAPGSVPKAGEKRLHVIVEGRHEMAVKQAKGELVRALDEETRKLTMMNSAMLMGSSSSNSNNNSSSGGGGSGFSGRYSVI